MAGVAGERINRKKPGTFTFVDILTGAKSDWQQARRHIQRVQRAGIKRRWIITDEDRYMNERFVDVWRELKALKTAHEAVTQALIERGRLTYDEVKAIIYRAQGGTCD